MLFVHLLLFGLYGRTKALATENLQKNTIVSKIQAFHHHLQGGFWLALHMLMGYVNNVITKHMGSRLPAVQGIFLRSPFGTLILLSELIFYRKSVFSRAYSSLYAMRGIILLLGIGAHILLCYLLKAFSLVDVSSLAPFQCSEFLISFALGFFFLEEVPASITYFGTVITILVTFFIIHHDIRKKER